MLIKNPWVLLFIAGVFEILWAIGLKYTEGFTKITPSIFTAISLIISMLLLAKSVESLPIGTAYAIWVGIGAFGTALLGIILFQEAISLPRLSFLALLIISIIGLKKFS